MSSYAQEVLRRREAAIKAEPVTGEQMGAGGLLHGLARAGVLSAAFPEGLGYFDALSARLGGGEPLDPMMYPPMAGGAIRIGGKYTPRTKGLVAETLEDGDPTISFEGTKENFRRTSGRASGYNLRNEANEIVASADRLRTPLQGGPRTAYVPEMWVREDYRKTPAMFDLYNLLSRGGRDTLTASFANDRLRKVFEKRMARQGLLNKDNQYNSLGFPVNERAAAAPAARLPSPPHIPMEKAQDIAEIDPRRGLRLAQLIPHAGVRYPATMDRLRRGAERAGAVPREFLNDSRQLTNRDVPSSRQMAPVRRTQPLQRPLNPQQRQEARYTVRDSIRDTLREDIERMEQQSLREALIRRSRPVSPSSTPRTPVRLSGR